MLVVYISSHASGNDNVLSQFRFVLTYRLEWRIIPVFIRENDVFGRQLPVDGKTRVVPCDGALGFWSIEIVALILEDSVFTQHGESMCKAFRDEELAMILSTETHSHMFAECRRIGANINSDIEYLAADHAHQLALGMRRTLKMKSADNAIGGQRFIVLYKMNLEARFLAELALIETFEEVATGIAVDGGFYDKNTC